MDAIALSLVPVFAIMAAGAAMARLKFVEPSFWPQVERVTYFVLVPALIVESIAGGGLDVLESLPAVAAMAAGAMGAAALVALVRPWSRLQGPTYTSVLQGTIRPNTYVSLAVAAAIGGRPGVALIGAGLAIVVPMVNLVCVTALARHGTNAGGGWRRIAGQLARNPLILSSLTGLAIASAGVRLPDLATAVLHVFAQASLPLGLLAVGAGLDLSALKGRSIVCVLTVAAKLGVTPGLTWVAAAALGLPPFQISMAVIYNAVPTAAVSYILARQMGGDARLMAAVIAMSTLASAVTLPLTLLVVA